MGSRGTSGGLRSGRQIGLPPKNGGVATIAIDQGSDGWSAAHWLMHNRTVLLLIGDASHRCCNDVELALRDSCLWQLALLCCTLVNIDEGAWRDARWWEQAKQAVREWAEVAGDDCPLMSGFAPAIRAEQGEPDMVGHPNAQARIFEILQECLNHKMVRVGMSRWFAYIDAMTSLLPQWSARLAIYSYIAVQLGQVSEVSTTRFAKVQMQRPAPGKDVKKTSTQHDKEEVRRLRSSCANTMVFAIKLLSDGDLRRISRGICDLVATTRLWHGAQSQTNRSAHESFAFFRDMASPRCLEHLQATMEVLQQPSFWERVGVDSRASPVPPPLDAEHPAILEQNDVAGTLAEFTFALIARRMSSLSWHLGYPGRLAALANPDESSSVAEAMTRDWQAWQHIGTLDGAFWSRFRKRSCVQFFVNIKFFEMLASADWEVTPEIARQAELFFAGVTQTKVIEDGFRSLKSAETSKSFKKSVAPMRAWASVALAGLSDSVHRFDPLPWRDEVVPRGLKDRIPGRLFQATATEHKGSFHDVASVKAAAPFYSPSPLSAIHQREDLSLASHC